MPEVWPRTAPEEMTAACTCLAADAIVEANSRHRRWVCHFLQAYTLVMLPGFAAVLICISWPGSCQTSGNKMI